MFAAIRRFFADTCAIAFTNGPGDSRFFPYQIAVAWRDAVGFNPAVVAYVIQTGEPDPYLLPTGERVLGFYHSLHGLRG